VGSLTRPRRYSVADVVAGGVERIVAATMEPGAAACEIVRAAHQIIEVELELLISGVFDGHLNPPRPFLRGPSCTPI
jgi:hypothetical protein